MSALASGAVGELPSTGPDPARHHVVANLDDRPAGSDALVPPAPPRATEEHVYRGLAGPFLLDDPEARSLPLRSRYGIDDIPVILQDKRFDGDGSLHFGQSTFSSVGRPGPDMLLNGTFDPSPTTPPTQDHQLRRPLGPRTVAA